jgi:hypothetical protein
MSVPEQPLVNQNSKIKNQKSKIKNQKSKELVLFFIGKLFSKRLNKCYTRYNLTLKDPGLRGFIDEEGCFNARFSLNNNILV